ncbi:MAG TPA: L-rhamnose mutarotase [Steroidobacteraceae bacterium]|jgi:L-rhamnose mutarotase
MTQHHGALSVEAGSNETEVVAFRMTLLPGHAAEYRRRHDDIWPELEAALGQAGVVDYRIFLDPQTHHLFAVMTRRKSHNLDSLRGSDLMHRWWKMMGDIMATNADSSPQEQALEPMFALTVAVR